MCEGLRPEAPPAAETAVARFLAERTVGVGRWRALLGELRAAAEPELGMLVVAVRALSELSPVAGLATRHADTGSVTVR